MVEHPVRGKAHERAITNSVTKCEPKLPKGFSFGKQRRHRAVVDVAAPKNVNLEDVAAVLGKCHHSVVRDLIAFVEFHLCVLRQR